MEGWNVGREEERDVRRSKTLFHDMRRSGHVDTQLLEDVRAAAAARHGSVAVFGNLDSARGDDHRGRRRHVERARAIATRAARIEHVARRRGQGHRMFAHRPGEARDFFRPLSLHDERREKAGERGRRRAAFHHFAHRVRGLISREVLVANELLDERGKHHRSRKFRRIFRPSPVNTDSGWN